MRGFMWVGVAAGFAERAIVLLYKSAGLPFFLVAALLSSLAANANIFKRGLVLGIGTGGR